MVRSKNLHNFTIFLFLIIVLFFGLPGISCADQQPPFPKIDLPLVVTTFGQSSGARMICVLLKQINFPCDRDDLLTAEHLKAKEEEGNTYKTLIITTGTSMKGMGAAGVDMDSELSRINAIIEEAKREGIIIIGAHIEGMARRVDAADTASIAAVIPHSNLLLIREDSNEDGYFTKVAEELSIPMILFEDTLDLADVFNELLVECDYAW